MEENEAYGLWGDVFVLVYAINDRSSFEDLVRIRDTLEQGRGAEDPTRFMLVGNKKDTEKEREITTEEGREFARSMDCSFYEVSTATSYEDIENVFLEAIKDTAHDLIAREAISSVRRGSHIKIKEIVAKHAGRHRAISSLKETIDEYCATKSDELGPESPRDRSNTCIF